jgi:hypothetical protein
VKNKINKLLVILLVITVSFAPIPYNYINTITVEAHSGRTDSSGGHKDNKNKSGLGSYHYHCGGNPAHLHENGICPYSASSTKATTKTPKASKKTSSSSSKETKSKKSVSSDIVKKVQIKLNDLGYDCGEPDGVMGKNSKAALKKFQEDNKLTPDGIIGNEVKIALGIS